MTDRRHMGISRAGATALVLIALITMIGAVAISDIGFSAQRQLTSTSAVTSSTTGATTTVTEIPEVYLNQKPANRYITVTWEKSPQAEQDRFTPANIVVAQGDTVHITFIVNDTSGHTFTIGTPYDFQINATIPGFTNDLTGQTFTTPSTDNSPGVSVSGTVGNVTGSGSFVAKYVGVYEYFCVYHVQIGMFGYLTVLPNAGYNSTTTTTTTPLPAGEVSIEDGSAANTTSLYYSPPTITVIIGVNNTVTWVNNDIAPHTVTDTGVFDSGPINRGGSWSYTFTTPGTYNYHCSYHPWMHGTVIVKSS